MFLVAQLSWDMYFFNEACVCQNNAAVHWSV